MAPAPIRPPDIRDVAARIAAQRQAIIGGQKDTTKQRVAPPRKTTAAPAMPSWYMTPAQQLALAQQEASTFYQPMLDEYHRQQATLAQQHAAQQAGLQQLYKVLADSFAGVPGQIQGVYQSAAQDQGLLGKGYSQGLQIAQDQAANQTNQQLNQIGAPAGQQEHPGSGAADALYAIGGAIPGNSLEQQGAGFASAASFLPAQAGMQGQMEFLKAVQAAQGEDTALSDQIRSLAAEIPGKAQGYLGDIQSQQEQMGQYADTQAYRAQQQANADRSFGLSQKNYGLSQTKAAWNVADSLTRTNGYRYTVNAQGNVVLAKDAKGQPIPTGSTAKPTKLIVTGSDAQGRVAVDPYTGQVVAQISPPGVAKPTAPRLFQGTDGRTWRYDPATNSAVPVAGQPSKSAKKAPTPAVWVKARKLLAQTGKNYYATTADPTTPTSLAALRGIISNYNSVAKQQKHTQITLANVYAMTPKELSVLGLTKKASSPQDTYLAMVQLGIPARQAWTMVARKYPTWGKGYFKPPRKKP